MSPEVRGTVKEGMPDALERKRVKERRGRDEPRKRGENERGDA